MTGCAPAPPRPTAHPPQALSSLGATLDSREAKMLQTWRDLNTQLNSLREDVISLEDGPPGLDDLGPVGGGGVAAAGLDELGPVGVARRDRRKGDGVGWGWRLRVG